MGATAGTEFINGENSKKAVAEGGVTSATNAIGVEDARLAKLASDGKVEMSSAQYKNQQALASEFKIKATLADKMKAQLKFQESDTKAKLKFEDLKAQIKELEDSRKAQDVEAKIKTAVKYQKLAAIKQKKVDDVVAEAESDEQRSVGMLSKAKYAMATASSAEQKVLLRRRRV